LEVVTTDSPEVVSALREELSQLMAESEKLLSAINTVRTQIALILLRLQNGQSREANT
jgi:hypothetical protein